MPIQWRSEYETGFPEVDGDHRQLIEGLNKLEAAIKAGAGREAIQRMLPGLRAYAAAHFAREETCMKNVGCPAAAANVSAHRGFVAMFDEAQRRLNDCDNPNLVAMKVHGGLCAWVSSHILKVDTALRSCHGSRLRVA